MPDDPTPSAGSAPADSAAALPPPVDAAPAAPHRLAVEFTGSGSEYFRIWIVNLLLTLVTLTLYHPFAKARKLAYFQAHTRVGGDALGVHGDPRRMLLGHLLVLDTPFFTRPDGHGQFQLDGLPAGAGELVVWHDRARPWRQAATPQAAATPVAVRLELSQRRVPPHMNKFGRPYEQAPRGGYR